jgi:integrase
MTDSSDKHDTTALVPHVHQVHDADPLAVIEGANLADSTRRMYVKALEPYLAAGHRITDVDALMVYAGGLSNSRRMHLKSAVSTWAREVCERLESTITPATWIETHATMDRLQSLARQIKVKPSRGHKTHTWLSARQVRELMASCGEDLQGLRDRVVLGLMVGAGLRRAELVSLTWEHVKWQPCGERMRTVLEVTGKGNKTRTVPISDRLAGILDAWGSKTGKEGRVVRSLGMAQEIGDSLSTPQVFNIVRAHGAEIGMPRLACHDLRRSFARLGYDAGIDIGQISILLGHASIATTQIYLGIRVDLSMTVSDFVPL